MRGRAVRGGAWAFAALVLNRLGTVIATAVLARLLSADEFGLVALAIALISFLTSLRDFGVTQAIVILVGEDEDEVANSAWRLSVGIGLALSLLLLAASGVIADFFGRDELGPIVAALGLVFLLRAPSQVHYALAQKHMDFRSRTAADVSDVAFRSTISVVLAFAGAGAWSLVIGFIAGAAARSVVLWQRVPWRPRRRSGPSHRRALLRQGMTLTAVDVNAAVIQNIDYAFVGKVLGAVQLGLYTLAFRIPEVVVKQFSAIAADVLFPAFAASDPRRLAAAFLESLRITMLLALPAGVVLMVLAEPILVTAFGEKWRGGADAMAVLSAYAMTSTISVPAGTVYRATGRARVILWLSFPRMALLVLSLILFTDEGIVAVALAQAGGSAVLASANVVLAGRLLGTGARAIVAAIAPSVAATAVMAAALLALAPLVAELVAALVLPILAVALYAAALRVLAPAELRRGRELLALLARR